MLSSQYANEYPVSGEAVVMVVEPILREFPDADTVTEPVAEYDAGLTVPLFMSSEVKDMVYVGMAVKVAVIVLAVVIVPVAFVHPEKSYPDDGDAVTVVPLMVNELPEVVMGVP